jgi:hypothetical protein
MIRRQNGVGSLARITIGEAGELAGRLLTFSSVSAKRIWVLLHFVGPWFVRWDLKTRRTGRNSTTAISWETKNAGPTAPKRCHFLLLPREPNHQPPAAADSCCERVLLRHPMGRRNVVGWRTIRFSERFPVWAFNVPGWLSGRLLR